MTRATTTRGLKGWGGMALALALGGAVAVAACAHGDAGGRAPVTPAEDGERIVYPKTRKGEQVDDYHGVKVADPYRWLEDTYAPETRAWIEAQNALTHDFLSRVPERAAIRSRLEQVWNYERTSPPAVRGQRYFFTRNDGLQNQPVYYVQDGLGGAPRVLIDPNTLSDDGTVAVSGYWASRDGARVAYAVSSAGSDWREIKVRDVASGQDAADHLRWVKFSGISWLPDGSGFYYSRYDEPPEGEALEQLNYHQKLYFHRLGTPQAEDQLVYERPDQKEWGFGGYATEDGRYLVIHVWRGTSPKNGVFYVDLEDPKRRVVELLADFDASYSFVGNDSRRGVFWFKTDRDAPRGKIVAIDLKRPQPSAWKTLVPEAPETLEAASVVGERFALRYLEHAHNVVRLHRLDGRLDKVVPLPGLGTLGGFGGFRDQKEAFYTFTSITFPPTVYRYDFATGQSTVFRKPAVDLDPERFVVEQVFVTSRDGTRVPMFVAHRKGLVRDGSNPTYLYGYGGFEVSLTPTYSASIRVWMEMGGVFAMPNLRGGGEYGQQWHLAGTKERKQNVFDDFVAAAEHLVAEGYTSPSKLAIGGGSNGGLLVGACMTQRPELFGAAMPQVGVMDMLRFHKFTIGWAWVSDYGSADDAEAFRYLYAYSPLHNLKPGTRYPATLVTTGDHDDRVVPGHSFKFAAALQAAQGGPAPTLIRVDTRAGHGAGKPTAKLLDEQTDRWAFLVKTLNMKLPAGF